MGCDKLKVYVPQDGPYGLEPEEGGEPVEEETCYLKSDVDAVIAELKDERDAFEKSFNEMTEAFMQSQRALCLARAYIMGLLQMDFQRIAYKTKSESVKRNLLSKRNKFYKHKEYFIKKVEEYK